MRSSGDRRRRDGDAPLASRSTNRRADRSDIRPDADAEPVSVKPGPQKPKHATDPAIWNRWQGSSALDRVFDAKHDPGHLHDRAAGGPIPNRRAGRLPIEIHGGEGEGPADLWHALLHLTSRPDEEKEAKRVTQRMFSHDRDLTIAVIAGEISGDLLGGDLIAALKRAHDAPVTLVGVGGEALQSHGLCSLFDFTELSIMGFTQALWRLPNFARRIRQTAAAIVAAKPNALILIDSPGFTHRVAEKVRAALPDLLIINYVCPSVWVWKEHRAAAMRGYVDHVLALLPFEPEAMRRLGGPDTTYVGHRLTHDSSLLKVRNIRAGRSLQAPGSRKTILLLPGSRVAEIRALLPIFGEAAREFIARNGHTRFILPTVPHLEGLVRKTVETFPFPVEVIADTQSKWRAFADADAAIAASGTVILELALSNVPVVSCYKSDWLIRLMSSRIKIWSAALPNLIADYPIVPEYINEVVRGGSLCRWAERLAEDTLQRRAMMEGFQLTWQRLQVPAPPSETAAKVVLGLLSRNSEF